MGTFHVKFTVRNPADPQRALELEGLVESGAHFSQIPGPLLEQIGLAPFGTRRIQYADATILSKPVVSADILIHQEVTPTVILWGGPNDLILLGTFTLEGLNLGVDLVRKTLVPLVAPQA